MRQTQVNMRERMSAEGIRLLWLYAWAWVEEAHDCHRKMEGYQKFLAIRRFFDQLIRAGHFYVK
jgi:hypothetical protein